MRLLRRLLLSTNTMKPSWEMRLSYWTKTLMVI